MLLSEDLVYLGTKALLLGHGWILLAGQPPNGCDHLPVVEVKSCTRTTLGSKGAYKPDLIAQRSGVFLLIECKPEHNAADANKLRDILSDDQRVALLYQEMMVRHLFERHHLSPGPEGFRRGLRGALAHSGPHFPLADLAVFVLTDQHGHGTVLLPTVWDRLLAEALA